MPSVASTPTSAEILAARPPKNAVDPRLPYAFLSELECTAAGRVEPVSTIFLTNRECPFRCLMCDLWKNTTDETVPAGAIVEQIDFALERLPPARHVKLYNSGNFFDPRAIPPGELPAIAERFRGWDNVIVENHPRLCADACLRFRDRLNAPLEVAIGLETIHPEVLPALNKQMTIDEFDRAVRYLTRNGIAVRAFVLVKPPHLDDDEGVEWAVRSVAHAFDVGATCCALIPTRGGNGILERMAERGEFVPPSLASLETAFDRSLEIRDNRRVFVDLWDGSRLAACARCSPARVERMRRMNHSQGIEPRVACDCGASA